jgi:hypothetical protein
VREGEGEGSGGRYVFLLCRVPDRGHSANVFFNLKIEFAECQITGTRQTCLCRVPADRHSVKYVFSISAECPTLDTRQSIFIFFSFPLPNFLWCVPTLCRPTCTILGQL